MEMRRLRDLDRRRGGRGLRREAGQHWHEAAGPGSQAINSFRMIVSLPMCVCVRACVKMHERYACVGVFACVSELVHVCACVCASFNVCVCACVRASVGVCVVLGVC